MSSIYAFINYYISIFYDATSIPVNTHNDTTGKLIDNGTTRYQGTFTGEQVWCR